MKKILFVFLVLVLTLSVVSCEEVEVVDNNVTHPETEGFECEFDDGSKTVTIKKYIGDETKVVIPSSFGEYKVTSIGRGAFSDNYDLESVDIPESVVSIGAFAFKVCVSLEEIKMTDKLESIGDTAFKDCRSLKSFVVPKGVKDIGDAVFNGCTSLVEIVVENGNQYFTSDKFGALLDRKQTRILQYPIGSHRMTYQMADSVKTIEGYAFERATWLENVKFSTSLESIGGYAFQGSSIKKADLSGTELKEIGAFAFNDTKLTEVKLCAALEKIGNSAFGWCSSISEVTIPSGVKEIGSSAFYRCFSVTKYVVEEGNEFYTSVDGVLFDKEKTTLIQYPMSKADKEYTVPDGVVVIKSNAFIGAVNLESVAIPDSVENIESMAFYDSWLLAKVDYIGETPKYIAHNAFEGTKITQ